MYSSTYLEISRLLVLVVSDSSMMYVRTLGTRTMYLKLLKLLSETRDKSNHRIPVTVYHNTIHEPFVSDRNPTNHLQVIYKFYNPPRLHFTIVFHHVPFTGFSSCFEPLHFLL